jgi:hypothetical protein
MTTTLNPNGRVRKNLADQIDRLDQILDGLADGLTEAVATAVKEAVGLAVQQAVAGVLGELLANPALLDQLRATLGVPAPPAPVPAPAAPRTSRAAARVAQARAWLGAGWQKARGLCTAIAGAMGQTLAAVRHPWRRARQLGVPILAAAAVGLLAGTVAFCGGPYVAAAAGWLAGFTATLAAQAGLWLRRTLAAPVAADTPAAAG